MKNILVFGTGFISKNILEYKPTEKRKINKVITYSRDSNFLFTDHHENAELKDFKVIDNIINKHKINSIFVFLGPSFPAVSFKNILIDIDNYLVPFLKFLKLFSKYKIDEIIMAGSAGTAYGTEKKNFYQEDNIIIQENSYGILLKAIENYLILFSKEYNFNYKILRLSNVFGKYHQSNENGFINIAIRQTLKSNPVYIYSKSLKNYIYAEDVGKIFWLIYDLRISNLILNISSDEYFDLSQICSKIKTELPNLKTLEKIHENNYDTNQPIIKNNKLKSLINFNFTPLKIAIKEVINWEKERMN